MMAQAARKHALATLAAHSGLPSATASKTKLKRGHQYRFSPELGRRCGELATWSRPPSSDSRAGLRRPCTAGGSRPSTRI